MPEINTINISHPQSNLGLSEGVSWWDSNYPYRIPVGVSTPDYFISEGETIEIGLSDDLVEMNKIHPDLNNIQVATFVGEQWQTVPTTVENTSGIVVKFQVVKNIFGVDTYYIYYGNRDLVLTPPPEFQGEDFYNSVDMRGRYVSFTNPEQDWDSTVDYVSGDTPGANFFARLYAKRFKIIGTKSPSGGKVQIYINNLPHSIIDFYNGLEDVTTDIFTHDLVDPGEVEVRLEILFEKNEISSGHKVRIDGIKYDTYSEKFIGREEIYPKIAWMSKTGAM